MSEAKQDAKSALQSVIRVGGNAMVLFDIGLFPGKHAVGIEECKGLIKSLVEDAQRQLEPKIEPAPAPATPPKA